MATQIDRIYSFAPGGFDVTIIEATLITSGTTITFTLPPGTRVFNYCLMNRTTSAVVAGGTYTESTGVWVSGTLAVNDVVTASFMHA